MDKNEIKKYLMKYAGLKMSVENQLERIARAENNTHIPAMRVSDGSQHQAGGSDRLGNSVIKWLEVKERLLPSIEANIALMRRIEDEIESLESNFESEVLRLRYIDCEHCRLVRWRDIAFKLYGDDDEKDVKAAQRLHDTALLSFGKVIEKHETNDLDLR